MPGNNLDISSDPPIQSAGSAASHGAVAKGLSGEKGGRQYIGVRFGCCDIYARIYVNLAKTAYLGHCPRCGKRLAIQIGPGGTDQRFFTAY